MSTKAEQAIAFHDQGYNCAQAVACSFCEEFGVDREEMFKIAEGFGFGMGIMDMCGALSRNDDGDRTAEQCGRSGERQDDQGRYLQESQSLHQQICKSRTAPISAVTSKA